MISTSATTGAPAVSPADLDSGRAMDRLRMAIAEAVRDLRTVSEAQDVAARLEAELHAVDMAILESLQGRRS